MTSSSGPPVQRQAGRSPGGADPASTDPNADKPGLPGSAGQVADCHGGGGGRDYLVNRGDHIHAGEDFAGFRCGDSVHATEDGRVVQRSDSGGYGNYIDLHTTSGYVIRYGHLSAYKANGNVKKGDVIALSGSTGRSEGCHLHFEVRKNDGFNQQGTIDPCKYLSGAAPPAGGAGGAGGGGGVNDTAAVEAIAKAAAFSTFIQMPGLFERKEAMSLTGHKSLMNDLPLLPFIQQLCQASLRHFQSMPNGNFFAFFPDYFGGLDHRTPYWAIEDIEILDGKIDLSDDALATHVYVVGDIAGGMMDGTIDRMDKIQTAGVVTIFEMFGGNFISGTAGNGATQLGTTGGTAAPDQTTTQATKPAPVLRGPGQHATPEITAQVTQQTANMASALAFLQKYGARPHFEEAPMVRSPFFELFLAYQKFLLMWAQQFATTFEFTFMPELFPGGIVAFPDHGIQCYIEEIEHRCSYEDGFTTKATLTAPAALTDTRGGPIDTAKDQVHAGMVRAFDTSPELVAQPGQAPKTTDPKPKPKPK